jgi:hypothetical protein
MSKFQEWWNNCYVKGGTTSVATAAWNAALDAAILQVMIHCERHVTLAARIQEQIEKLKEPQ